MAGGSGRVRTGGGISKTARVENERLWVDAVISSGGGGSSNVTIVAPLPVPVDIQATIAIPVTDNGGSLTVDGTVAVSSVAGTVTVAGTVNVTEPVSVDDNGGSLTVDGTVAVSSVAGTVTVAGTVSVTEPVSVDDNGGSLTVDGTVAVSSVGGTVTVADGGGSLTIDGTVDVGPTVTPGTAATNLGKAEDVAHTTGDVGVMALAVRNDAATALAGTTLDYIPITTDATGKVYTTSIVTSVVPGVASTSLGKAEDAVHASGATGVMALAVRLDGRTPLAASGDYIPMTTDASGNLHTNAIVTSVVPGTAATSLGKAEDAVHASGDTGVMSLAVRQDTLAPLSANGDYIPLTTDSLGRLNVRALIVESFTVLALSSSTSGQPIVVDTTGFVNIHTVAASSIDLITIYATNVGTTDRTIVLGWGGTATGQQMFCFVPTGETVVVASGMALAASQVVQAKLNAAGTVRVVGQVVRRAA